VRRFRRRDEGFLGLFASRICGRPIFTRARARDRNINFTCHNGFTLNDLGSYAGKHNQANGEENADSIDESYSANYGAEGDTNDAEIQGTRVRQTKISC
jgi:isoamylase